VTFPLNAIVVILLFFANRRKIFFIQPRPGKNGRIFFIIKYRTMNELRNKNGELLTDEERITPIGKFIRESSIDELPQLINVLKGELSLVGPRPLLVEYLPRYNDFQKRRLEIRPGITGWAQVNGRNAITWEKKFYLDVWYVDNISFRLDCKIMFYTLIKVFKSSGISSDTSATMEKFAGN
jgi:undecaprenyl phosphate N,N'-diacetylbacillosamine 1-phosphate transferase